MPRLSNELTLQVFIYWQDQMQVSLCGLKKGHLKFSVVLYLREGRMEVHGSAFNAWQNITVELLVDIKRIDQAFSNGHF